jgi:mRNA interferase RelE/StbE
MENYKVDITNSARKEIKNLDSQITKRIVEKLKSLEENPFPFGYKKLIARNGYKIKVGDYRIIYDVLETEKIVRVYKAGHRKDIYK